MAFQYTIALKNQHGSHSNYGVFMEPPQFSVDQKPWMNVWYTTFVPSGGDITIQTGVDFYAWAGSVNSAPAPGIIVSGGMVLMAGLGTSTTPGSTFDLQVEQSFPILAEVARNAPSGAYEIKCGTDFDEPNNKYLVGLAKPNHRGQVVPVASVAPGKNTKVQISPKLKFFIAETQHVAGEIVDYSAVSSRGATIDFSSGEGLGKHRASVVHAADGTFTVTYDS
ncbi:hypothetical protein ANOM_003683 [Aspergillus nomiae NRRL 13137]|uniref:Uncharacterized protein n=1 Tax=Aspergillus nomiae NRRL (strain ATCC 15546 / NRRL 13137 / CBS 260.88 / M93) TaxID=1509407 RepID=A0A0L1JAW6_ASPN3|nr:uncharacterized protein ANOM_003683 [Aspergillus nomiae NRRL 13137]KNG88862.1 hypothetical protein ANOM_003683 [Aspergillus nomiae NRRL 13137]